ncbi:type I restriction enzyme subunit R domain-containing protein [Enterococcus faecalis]|uniref:type I restriction enzyme subunit R domain-containing protein n=1 Tax=Enterococcus faecalis TaxID=1351 RepID=UPI002953161B|nr:hypothetical protein [Enterococcus faecalis]MDV7870705.1 hypothetical protein [Enterococcus faecalis]
MKTYYNIISASDEKVLKSEATKKIGRFVSLHPHNIAQKVEVIVEHFRERTQHKLDGRAKAMLVTSSRLHAVRYKLAMDDYIKRRHYKDMETLVAFSGKVEDGNDTPYTESNMNGFSENELPDKFHTDDFQVLIVAEKYQTGFDEPLLQTMYVDKPLSGVKAVQTLSRLNRTCPGKSDTFILDFVNETEEIKKAFQPYYETTALESETDPNLLYELKDTIDQYEIVTLEELDTVASLVMSGNLESSATVQGKLNSIIDKGVERYIGLDTEDQEIFRDASVKYLRTYGFLLQIIDFADVELHKMYLYVNYLIRKLPKKKRETFTLPDDVALKYYKIKQTSVGTIGLEKTGIEYIEGVGHGVSPIIEEEEVSFSDIINKINERFGTNFEPEDKLFMDQVTRKMHSDESFVMKAKNNSFDNFVLGVEKQSQDILIDKYETNSKFVDKYLTDDEFKSFVLTYMLKDVYEKVHN